MVVDRVIGKAKALCLNMIVKDEMANLERCLGSVAPYIACWVIGDTGSTDGTQEFIRSFFAARDIPGELHSLAFEDFAQARNEALRRARTSKLRFDYLLLIDANLELTIKNPEFAQNLTSASYKIPQRSGVTSWNIRLLRRHVSAGYKGVMDPYLDVLAGKPGTLEGVSLVDYGTASNGSDKSGSDVRVLMDAIAEERNPEMLARYTSCLASALRDMDQKEMALRTYLKSAGLAGSRQEVFVSLLNAAELKEALQYPDGEIIAAYASAIAVCPTRAEAHHAAARFCRDKGLHEKGYQFAAKGMAIPYPNDGQSVRDWIYDYGLLDELAVHAYWTGHYQESADACERLLSEGKLPAEMRDRIAQNKAFAVDRIREASVPVSPETEAFIKLLGAAREKEQLEGADDEVISAYLEASAVCPTRAEALHGAARFCRIKGIHEQGYQFAGQGLAIAHPEDAPSVEHWIYDYGLLDELAVNSYWTGRYAVSAEACDRLLREGKLPTTDRDRVQNNRQFAVDRLTEMTTPRQASA